MYYLPRDQPIWHCPQSIYFYLTSKVPQRTRSQNKTKLVRISPRSWQFEHRWYYQQRTVAGIVDFAAAFVSLNLWQVMNGNGILSKLLNTLKEYCRSTRRNIHTCGQETDFFDAWHSTKVCAVLDVRLEHLLRTLQISHSATRRQPQPDRPWL